MIEVRSYRRVFDLERRLYSVERLRLNPGGVPVRGLVYLLVALAAVALLDRLPVLGAGASAVPWYVRFVALPLALACGLSLLRLDGRPLDLTARSLVRHLLSPRRLARLERLPGGGRVWLVPPIVLLPDGSEGRLRRMRYTGPGAVLVACEHERGHGRRGSASRWRLGARATVTLRADTRPLALAEGRVLVLESGARLLVGAGARRGRVR